MWKDLTMSQRADMMDLYLSKGITSLDDMRSLYDSSISDTAQGTSFSGGGSIHIKPENRGKFTALKERTGHSATWFKEHGTPAQRKMATFALNAAKWKHGYGGNLFETGGDTVGEWVNALYQNNPKEEYLGEPSHHYDFTQTDEWADAHGYYPDDRGHRDDRVKKPAHPSHPSRGVWDKDKFILTDKGIQDSNYILFGLNDGGQDPQANLVYRGGNVVPEITVTPRGNYVYNPYDNIKLKYKYGGHIYDGTSEDTQQMDVPYAGELPDVTVMPRRIANKSWDKVQERWVGDMPTYYAVNPETGKEEMLREIGNGKYSTYDDRHVFDVLAAEAAKKQKEQWIKNGGNASDFDKVMLGTLGLGLAPIALPEIAAGVSTALANPYVDAGLTSYFGAHGLNHAINEGIDGWGDAAMTALEVAPLGRLVKPIYEGVVQPGIRLFNSPLTGKWTKIGNKEYRLSPNSLGMNGVSVESKPARTVRLYRATGTNGNFEASLDGGQEFTGQWFTNNPTKPQHYASMTVKRAKRAGADNPIELQYVDIPESELNKYRASEILKGRTDIEYEPTEDFLIPLDYPRQRVPLEGYTGNYLQDARRPLPELDIKSTTPQITAENAASITPEQWTAAQDAAIARGDMTEAQRLRDLHFNIYGDTIVSYHGQTMPDNMYTQRGLNPYNDKRDYGFYSSSSNDVANTYNFVEGSPTFKLYTHFNKPYVINANKATASKTLTDRTYLQKSKEGYDGVIIKDIYDVGFRNNRLNGASGLADDIIATPGRSKLADAVTYDDNGIRIPLGERDNFNINDIRYGLIPFGTGLTGYGLYNSEK